MTQNGNMVGIAPERIDCHSTTLAESNKLIQDHSENMETEEGPA